MILLSPSPILTTQRLRLRAPVAGDWPFWRDFAVTERARFIRPAEFDDGKSWRAFGHIIGHWVMRGYGMFVFTRHDDDTSLGMVGPWCPAGWPEREIGWTVWSADAEGKGYAHEAVLTARAYAFDKLGWDTAVSYIDTRNARSIALAERLGAVLDPKAEQPAFDGAACLVYRHPSPAHRQGEPA